MGERKNLGARLTGRAQFLRDREEIKSPRLLDLAAQRIAEMEEERDKLRWKLTTCLSRDKRFEKIKAKRRELVELLEEYLLVKNRWEREAHDQKVEAALAKLDAQEKG